MHPRLKTSKIVRKERKLGAGAKESFTRTKSGSCSHTDGVSDFPCLSRLIADQNASPNLY